MARARKKTSVSFNAITVEGGLLTTAMLASITARQADQQKEEDYNIPKGLTLRDEVARYFRIGQALFQDLNASPTPSHTATNNFAEAILRDVFCFEDIKKVGERKIDDQTYPVTLEAIDGRVPIVVVPPTDDLDRVSQSLLTEGRKRSASSAIQDWLNANEDALWGLCLNGERIRLVRDNASFTRPAYIEVNLRQIFEAENFADFTTLWLAIHSSRFGIKGSIVSDCALEKWRDAGSKEGLAARDRLRDGVETALLALGNGFLSHPQNGELRASLENGDLALPDYFNQLLRLVYRLIFLLAAEDRDLLHPPATPASLRKLYAEGYSLSCLRSHSIRRASWDRYHDKWDGLKITFKALSNGESLLGLPALGGLFSEAVTPQLENASLANKALMEAIFRLTWLKEPSGLIPVNWRDMETEELGSVYESLLELTPRLSDHGKAFSFAEGIETKGNARKTTGSYYTPDSLVQALLDSTLNPVLNRTEAEAKNIPEAFLKLAIIDPACGSGHFLLAAARRIASRLARARAGGVASAEDYRHALREVARNCIYGVDRNPMAVELTKVALWIETVEPGKPLGFLDANIRCGDALLGITNMNVLREGIPDAAYLPLTGDSKDKAKHYSRQNKEEKDGQGTLGFLEEKSQLPPAPPFAGAVKSLRILPEDNVKEITEKKRTFEGSLNDPARLKWKEAADMYVAAFLASKAGNIPSGRAEDSVPTTASVWAHLSDKRAQTKLITSVRKLAHDSRVFHWPLEFPEIMERGGFDVVLGNPPWERVKLQEKEFFASRDPDIAEAPTAAARRKLIAELSLAAPGSRQRALFEEFEEAKRSSEAASLFTRESGRYPLTGRGDVNTYALFTEHFKNLIGSVGRAGVIVPTGIATDASTAPFFAHLVDNNQLVSLIDFENTAGIFLSVASLQRFCLLTLGQSSKYMTFSFLLNDPAQMEQSERRFTLSPEQISEINPNTKTASIFRTRQDADLVAKIYKHQPVLINRSKGNESNPWNVGFLRMFDMSNDSDLFVTADQIDDGKGYLPLYEAKMMSIYDHRFGSYPLGHVEDTRALPRPSLEEKKNASYEINSRFYTSIADVRGQILDKWNKEWFLCYRSMSNHSNIRRFIAGIIPFSGVGNSLAVVMPTGIETKYIAALLANFSSLVFDFVARNKLSGTNLNFFFVEQFPVIPPDFYKKEDLDFILPRVLELTYTSHAMKSFAADLEYQGEPFVWDDNRRSIIRAELDAWYAHAYNLNRDELRYILDPSEVMGENYPSETFRVLKEREIEEFGEFRTRRLVLHAWDQLFGQKPAIINPVSLSDAAWARPTDGSDTSAATLAQLAAIIKALPGPIPISHVRLAALYALEPQYLTKRLAGKERATWQRLVGPAANISSNVTAFSPRINAGWRDAVTQLRGMGALVEDAAAQTWAPGNAVHEFDTTTWPDGRASFALKAIDNINLNDAAKELAVEDRAWVAANAA